VLQLVGNTIYLVILSGSLTSLNLG